MIKCIYQLYLKKILFKNKNILFEKESIIDKRCLFGGYNSIGTRTIFLSSEIGEGSYISSDCRLNKIKIGKFCSIGQNVKNSIGRHPSKTFVSTHPAFFSNQKQAGFSFVDKTTFKEHLYIDKEKLFHCSIGNDVWIGNEVTIFDGVNIGDGAIIANRAVVTKDVEPYSIVGGVPSKLIRKRFSKQIIQKLLQFKWWNKDFGWIMKNKNSFSNIDEFNKLI